jgi:hypothetical protein
MDIGTNYATAFQDLGLDPVDDVSPDFLRRYKRKDTEVQWTLHPMKDENPIERSRGLDHGALQPFASSDWIEVKRSNAKPVSVVPLKRMRAYEANDPASTVMSDLGKGGSAKRIGFQVCGLNSSPRKLPFLPKSRISHIVRLPAPDPMQREIQRNYSEFLENKAAGETPRKQGQHDGHEEEAEEERKAFENAFLEDSQMEGWTTETSVSSLELGV